MTTLANITRVVDDFVAGVDDLSSSSAAFGWQPNRVGQLGWQVAAIGAGSDLAYVTGEPHGVLRSTTSAVADGNGVVLRTLADGIVINGKEGGFRARVRYPNVTGNAVEGNNFRIGIDASVAATTYTASASVDVTNTGDLFTLEAHGLTLNDRITLLSSTATGVSAGDNVWPVTITADDFQVSLTKGGAAIEITGDGAVTYATLYETISGPTDGIWVESDGGILSLQVHSADHDDTFARIYAPTLESYIPTGVVTAEADDDTFTLTAHGLFNGDKLRVVTTNATGISADDIVYVVNRQPTTFQLSTTELGAPINITVDGNSNTFVRVGKGTEAVRMIEGTWYDLDVRWSGVNAQGGPAIVKVFVDGHEAATARCFIDNDETMELKVAHWQDTGAAGSLEFDIDRFEYFQTR